MLILPTLAAAATGDKPQLQLGDTLSIFSDRAFRKEQGDVFEAVGNVVVVSGKDTLYGEAAYFDRRTMVFKIEGNVRLITGDMTLYGSRMEYQAETGYAEVENARIVNPQFNIVARFLKRRSEKIYEAQEAEFTTCRDCVESWSVYGKRMMVYMDDRAEIHHGLVKIKGSSVLYVPYFVVPLSKRKTGLLFPNVFNRLGEGFGVNQPFFWAMDESKDATISPTLWAKRGYGSDLEYRQRMAPERWLTGNTRVMEDKIYRPEDPNSQSESGSTFTRYFVDAENHWLWTPNLVHHLRYTGVRDLDMKQTHPEFIDPSVLGSELGFQGHVEGRTSAWSLGVTSAYSRNLLYNDADEFDAKYVQTLPRVYGGTTPISLIQSDIPMLQHIYTGVDASFTRFRQVEGDDRTTTTIRNADRITALPYLDWHFFTWGPVSFKSGARFDYQRYHFPEVEDRENADKNATMLKSEMTFTVDRIFGLAYEEKVPWRELPASERAKLKPAGDVPPVRTSNSKLVGQLPDFESSITDDQVKVARQAYRHSQEYKFIHHFISSENSSGNARFLDQIEGSSGWFDYNDAVRSREYLLGANLTRTTIPVGNTLELQWNNNLIRKTPKNTDWRTDQRYLRDNFSYDKMGYFNLSQGYIFDQELVEFREKLTRLALQAGYTAAKWNLSVSEYFFHMNSQHIFQTGAERRFDMLSLLASYNYNSFEPASLDTLSAGFRVLPIDTLGFAMMKQMDLEANEDIRTVYALDIMPNNNCWILTLNYRTIYNSSQYSFNILWNFGDDTFQNYRRDWFRARPL